MTTKLKVVILDDHEILCHGLRVALERDGDVTIVGEAIDARAAYALLDHVEADVLVTDLMLPGDDGITVTRETRRRRPGTRVVVVSGYDRVDLVTYAFEAGASAFVLKSDPTSDLRAAVDAAARGERYVSRGVDARALTELRSRRAGGDRTMPLDPLSPREREVFRLQTRGLSCKEIARELFISDKTVQTHRARIFRKLHVHSAAELVHFAAVHGLISPPAS
jgi:DNA-binding NarL/FixJ family response regulator